MKYGHKEKMRRFFVLCGPYLYSTVVMHVPGVREFESRVWSVHVLWLILCL